MKMFLGESKSASAMVSEQLLGCSSGGIENPGSVMCPLYAPCIISHADKGLIYGFHGALIPAQVPV